MAKTRANAKTTRPPSPGAQAAAAIVFNVGLALFVGGVGWYLVSGPAISWAAHWARVALCCAGLATAVPAWIAGSPLATSAKGIIAALAVSGVLGLSWWVEHNFAADDQVLQPWRRVENRLVHDGLGLSVPVLPSWRVNPQPEIVKSGGAPQKGRTRLWYGEVANFLMMVHERPGLGEARIGTTLIIRGGPDTYGSLHQATATACGDERRFAEQPGAKILSSTRVRDLHGMDVLMFEGSDAQGCTWHEVFFRSGSYLLNLEMRVTDSADREQVIQFLNSIRVSGRATELNE
jgi:hypothetical protein